MCTQSNFRVISSCKNLSSELTNLMWRNGTFKDFIKSDGHLNSSSSFPSFVPEVCRCLRLLKRSIHSNKEKQRAPIILGWSIWACHRKMITWYRFNCRSSRYLLVYTGQNIIWQCLKVEAFCSFEKPAIRQRRLCLFDTCWLHQPLAYFLKIVNQINRVKVSRLQGIFLRACFYLLFSAKCYFKVTKKYCKKQWYLCDNKDIVA